MKNESIQMEKEEMMEKVKECKSTNCMLAKKIEEVEETVDGLKHENKELEKSVKETKAENEALKAKENLGIQIDESKQVTETTEKNDGETDNQCSKCDFIGKTEAGLKTHYTTKHVPLFKRYTKINKEGNQ